MPRRRPYVPFTELPTYPREAVLTIEELAEVLRVSTRQIERLDLPTVYLGAHTRRFIWGTILDTLAERAA
jgi:hypothetical protein